MLYGTRDGSPLKGKEPRIVEENRGGTMVRFINITTSETMLRKVKSVEEYHMIRNMDPIRNMLFVEGSTQRT